MSNDRGIMTDAADAALEPVRCKQCGKLMVAQSFYGYRSQKCFLCKMFYPEPEVERDGNIQ